MLNQSAHGWKVNFCKFTNETRNGIEDATAESKQTYIAAVNGPCAGGGYELALAADYILMADDGNTSVSLPEETGRAHVCTPVTNAHLVCRLMLEKKKS